MAKAKTTRPLAKERISSLTPHILTLAKQASDQLAELSRILGTHLSLCAAVEPESEEDAVDFFASPDQVVVLRRSLNREMQWQVKTLGHSIDAIYACAAELKRRP